MSAAISHEAPYSILWRLWRLWTVNCGLSTVDCGLWRLWSTSPITQTEAKDPPVNVPPWEPNLPAHLHTSSSFTLNHNWEPKIPAHLFTKFSGPCWCPSSLEHTPLKPTSSPTQVIHRSSSPKLTLLNMLHEPFPPRNSI